MTTTTAAAWRACAPTPVLQRIQCRLRVRPGSAVGPRGRAHINQYDVSLDHENEFETFDVAAGIGYYAKDDDAEIWAGSASVLHTPTVVNGTFAAGSQDENGDNGSNRTASSVYLSRRPDDTALRGPLSALAEQRRRFGYRRLYVPPRGEGRTMNRKKTQWLHGEEAEESAVEREKPAVILDHRARLGLRDPGAEFDLAEPA